MARTTLTRYLIEAQRDKRTINADLRQLYEANPMAFVIEQATAGHGT